MPHIPEEQISAYVDGQLGADERRAVEAHLKECENCNALLAEMRDVTMLFRKADRLEPSPFLWNRIAAGIQYGDSKERSSARHWGLALISGLRRYAFNPGIAAAALGILIFLGIAVSRYNGHRNADQAALAEINRVYKSLAAQNPETYNPFSTSSLSEFDSNPFRSVRLSGRSNGAQ